jgi:hypothetical protein
LTRIGTAEVVRQVAEAYPQGPEHFRHYATSVFGDIHSDLAVSTGLELLGLERDPDIRIWMAIALLDQFSSEAVDAARVLPCAGHFDVYDLKQGVVTACKLMEYAIPELEAWDRELSTPARRAIKASAASVFADRDGGFGGGFDGAFDDMPSGVGLPTASGEKTGRNDPCPCGSGKKFKKCCLPKLNAAR